MDPGRERTRYEAWLRDDPSRRDAAPAATVILLRDAAAGLEVLMLRRNSKLAFAGGLWVFPGGRLDAGDYRGSPGDVPGAARRAAAREVSEEAGLRIEPDTLRWLSHWTPPAITSHRFATWFFVDRAPEAAVTVDGAEIHDHGWMQPATALRRRDAQEVELAPPTWITLHRLQSYTTVEHALQDVEQREPEFFETRLGRHEEGVVALYHGDAGYEDHDPGRAGPRHRLWIRDDGWRYERDPAPEGPLTR